MGCLTWKGDLHRSGGTQAARMEIWPRNCRFRSCQANDRRSWGIATPSTSVTAIEAKRRTEAHRADIGQQSISRSYGQACAAVAQEDNQLVTVTLTLNPGRCYQPLSRAQALPHGP